MIGKHWDKLCLHLCKPSDQTCSVRWNRVYFWMIRPISHIIWLILYEPYSIRYIIKAWIFRKNEFSGKTCLSAWGPILYDKISFLITSKNMAGEIWIIGFLTENSDFQGEIAWNCTCKIKTHLSQYRLRDLTVIEYPVIKWSYSCHRPLFQLP